MPSAVVASFGNMNWFSCSFLEIRRIALASDWESSFSFWAQSPSKTEQQRCERVIKAIKTAIGNSSKLQARNMMWSGKSGHTRKLVACI